MSHDVRRLLALPPRETRWRFSKRDTMLYALGVGASELPFVYEEGLKALPSMPVIMAYPGFIWREPEIGVDWKKVLHGESSVTLHRPLPVEGELVGYTRFDRVFDKGAEKGAVVYQTRDIHDENGDLIATVGSTSMLRGDGGFGGESTGQPLPHTLRERAPDLTHTLTTSPAQALIYRLSGDYNPLHIDPEVAKAAGFERPILHGLCTFGLATRAVLAAACDNDPARLAKIEMRFSSPVYPGESIATDIWREGDKRVSFRARCVERDRIVLNNGYAELR